VDPRAIAALGAELRRRADEDASVAELAARAVELVYGFAHEGRPACALVRAFLATPLARLPPSLREEARRRAPEGSLTDETRCLCLVATRGTEPDWNDVERSAAHRVLPLSDAALAKAPMVAELVRQLGLHVTEMAPRSTFHVPHARDSGLVPAQDFVALNRIESVFGFGAEMPTGDALVIVAFSRVAVDRSAVRPFELVGLSVRLALLGTKETRAQLDEGARLAARAHALEDLCAVQHAHAAESAMEARAAMEAAALDARRATEAGQAELLAQNNKLRRTQRAMLNVVEDLREARASLEAKVAERTRRVVELLESERASRQEAETARAQAEGANRMKDQFLSTVSHELRTPLNAMLGWATMLREDVLAPEKRATAIETIERNARAQVRLIEDLLDLARILQGKFQLAVGPVEVVPIVESAIESLRPAAEAKGVRLQRMLDSHATIVGDGERLQQITWNLISNAIKFTPRGGRVMVTVRRAASHVELEVSDTGQGIDAAFLPHVFEPFRQANGGISRRAGGLGLGLSIVRSLVELHGGTVSAASEGAGAGSTFTVRVPVAPVRASSPDVREPRSAGEAPAPTFDCPPALANLKVLVVDDEKDTRELIAFVLEQCHAVVTMAGDAHEALKLLESASFDAMISDVGMPDLDGLTMMRRLRALPGERAARVPALALTAYARAEDRAEALRAGFNMHLAKPVDPSELVLAVAAVVGSDRRQ
jgi:signal transduction histidine kinase/ActR/RegA family two-component response regulator